MFIFILFFSFTHADNAGVIVNNKGEMKGMHFSEAPPCLGYPKSLADI